MTRQEENKKYCDAVAETASQKAEGTYEEMVSFQLGVIGMMLVDISKSLAIIADSKVIYHKQDRAESGEEK